jgi:hypothetical protein
LGELTASKVSATVSAANVAPPVQSTGARTGRWAGATWARRRATITKVATIRANATANWSASSRSDRSWFDSTISRLRGSSVSSKSSAGSWRTVTLR